MGCCPPGGGEWVAVHEVVKSSVRTRTQSRYDKIHGDDGLCCALVKLFHAMAEIRMKVEYGDYLAYAYSILKTESMNDLARKIDRLDW